MADQTQRRGRGGLKIIKRLHTYLLLVVFSCLTLLKMLMGSAWSPSKFDSLGGMCKFSAPFWPAAPNAPDLLFLPLDRAPLWIFEVFRAS